MILYGNKLSTAHKLLKTGAQVSRFCTTNGVYSTKYLNANRQGKIIGKLFGNRVAGSKKRWYPQDSATGASSSNEFETSAFSKRPGAGNGKNTTRRMTVLNKLFMTHITDQLASGQVSQAVAGYGLQITRVKISADFTFINVYWLGSGDTNMDEHLERELRRCSGLLRHELSQLELMGEVPRIHFVPDKTHMNLAQVAAILKNIDFGPEQTDVDYNFDNVLTKNEFFGEPTIEPEITPQIIEDSQVLGMRHDVLGLNHREVMSKILTKMRKSKQAWDLHYQATDASTQTMGAEIQLSSQLEQSTPKIEAANQNTDDFDKFLFKRRESKNTPERKKYRRIDDWINTNAGTDADVYAHQPRTMYDDDDYIHEELENDRKY